MTDKLYTVAGSSTQAGKTKIRFANDVMRIKILAKNGHSDINLVELPKAMTKGEIAAHMRAVEFGKGNAAIQAAIAHIEKKNKVTAPVQASPKKEAVPA